MIHETRGTSIHLQVKMTDPKGSDLVVTNLRTEEVNFQIPIILPLHLNVRLQVLNEAHVEGMMRRAGKTRAQVKVLIYQSQYLAD